MFDTLEELPSPSRNTAALGLYILLFKKLAGQPSAVKMNSEYAGSRLGKGCVMCLQQGWAGVCAQHSTQPDKGRAPACPGCFV